MDPLKSKIIIGDELIDLDLVGLDLMGSDFLTKMTEAQQLQDT